MTKSKIVATGLEHRFEIIMSQVPIPHEKKCVGFADDHKYHETTLCVLENYHLFDSSEMESILVKKFR